MPMSPQWIVHNADITGKYSMYLDYFVIEPTTGGKYQRALEVKVVDRDVLASDDDIMVTVTIAMNATDLPDHDPVFGITDKEHFVGFKASDPKNYALNSPCSGIQGDVVGGVLTNVEQQPVKLPIQYTKRYSSEIKVHIKPTEFWGSCHTEVNNGLVTVASYGKFMDLNQALYFQFYHNDAAEKYRIEYIIVEVKKESKD